MREEHCFTTAQLFSSLIAIWSQVRFSCHVDEFPFKTTRKFSYWVLSIKDTATKKGIFLFLTEHIYESVHTSLRSLTNDWTSI